MAIQELVVEYDLTALSATVERRRRLFRGRVISLGITLVIMVVFYLWQRALFSPAVWILYAIGLVVAVGFLVFRLVAYRRAAAELAVAGSGVAIRIGRGGVQVGALGAPWSEVAGLTVVRRGAGREPGLQLRTSAGGTGTVPLDQVAVFPATLDSTARAYSANRHGVDLSALDS